MNDPTTPAEELERLGERLRAADLTIAVAESMTGGLLAAALADMPESSKRFLGGVVSYTVDKKMEILDVPESVISKNGVISAGTARLMAQNVRRVFKAGVSISVTGVAGPQTQEGKPIGLTYIGVSAGDQTDVREYRWQGDRRANRAASVKAGIVPATEVLSADKA